ncbi:hypothetical protein DSM106972_054930 [Dulcicalothrix desertica PCC 7102]|uniref:Uncharacterized protein n=1 Tax=Dulcicalothrix desertica PCC 7102 TaxID=232991 RepID=A0A433VAQ1_9CYAN|nr:hypothetical protein DSM106972_054930 [Dulcicalothrix desertica PCC 7102]
MNKVNKLVSSDILEQLYNSYVLAVTQKIHSIDIYRKTGCKNIRNFRQYLRVNKFNAHKIEET